MGGIYRILNIHNGKLYIGSTSNFRKRFREHLRDLREGAHYNPRLQNAFNKYGESAFKFEVVEVVDDEQDLIVREQWHLDNTKSYDRFVGYNISSLAHAPRLNGPLNGMYGRSRSERVKALLREAHSGERNARAKRVYQYDMDGFFVRSYGSAREASRETGISHHSVIGCCNERQRHAGGFVFSYAPLSDGDLSRRIKLAKKPIKANHPKSIPVIRLSKDGAYLGRHRSIYAASKDLGVDLSSIAKACRGDYETAGGFRWMYAEQYEQNHRP